MFLPGKSRGQRSLTGYSLGVTNESDSCLLQLNNSNNCLKKLTLGVVCYTIRDKGNKRHIWRQIANILATIWEPRKGLERPGHSFLWPHTADLMDIYTPGSQWVFWGLESLIPDIVSYLQVAQRLKRLPAMRETWVQSLGWEEPLEKEMATYSSILAWRIPWTEEPDGL